MVTNLVSNEDCFVTARRTVPTVPTKTLAVRMGSKTNHNLRRPCEPMWTRHWNGKKLYV